MRVSINWLRDLVSGLDQVSVDEIAEKLTMAGLEVEAVEDPGAQLAHVVVAKILEKHQHPKADKLSLCLMDAGGDKPIRVVCGAPNHQQGDWVIFAQVGAHLANGMDIGEATIRGEKSFGMLCSESEWGCLATTMASLFRFKSGLASGDTCRPSVRPKRYHS